MRLDITHPGAAQLHYEIRNIVKFAEAIERTGIPITWENIGDPVAKKEYPPQWVCDIVAEETRSNPLSYAYSPTKGLPAAREFLARAREQETGVPLSPEHILFFNGLGDAVTKIYTWLNPDARVLGPNPAYPTHSSIEGAHGRSSMLTYRLDPDNNWWPDVEDVRRQVRYNPNIAALLVINPDNPTGMVYPREVLLAFTEIAREHNLFLIADEIYAALAYEGSSFVSMPELADGVPTIVMRGLSKEIPWPGARSGWLEFYNIEKDQNFKAYAHSIEEAKMNEVCSTTLPQMVLPKILGDERYAHHLQQRRRRYEARAEEAVQILGENPVLKIVQPKGACYLAVTFSESFFKNPPKISAANPEAGRILNAALAHIPPESRAGADKRFCYQLLAASGICTVPLSTGFNSYVPGFRMTMLESDDHKRLEILHTITEVLK